MYSCHLLLISSASVGSIPFLSFIEPIFAWNVPLVSLIFLKRSRLSHSVVFLYLFALITEELYKKDLHDPDNHNGVITHLEPDILECEVKWALESITTNKASEGDGIPVELFQILKD